MAARKPARKQVPAPVTGHEETHAAGTFNIWTGRKLKDYRNQEEKKPREASKYRCRPQLDSGHTRGEGADVSYCCLYFARGLCHHGAECDYLHRVPTEADEARHRCDYSHDIFGRERGPSSRDGRKKGVGSYERECQTLYVHYGGAGALPVLELRKLLEENFKVWGPIDDIHVVPTKTIAFVRYAWRSSAEFAKQAMHQQGLEGSRMGEVLDVRWANDDPNPRAVQRVKREREGAFRDAYLQAVMDMGPEQKQARLMQLNLLANVRPGCTTSQYPDTNGQYTHEYEGWDQYYQQGDSSQPGAEGTAYQAASMRGAHYFNQQPYGGWVAGPVAGAGSGDDIARYLPTEAAAWQQAQQQLAQQQLGGDQEPDVPEEFLEFTPDLVEAAAAAAACPRQHDHHPQQNGQPNQLQQQHQQGQQPEAAGNTNVQQPDLPGAPALVDINAPLAAAAAGAAQSEEPAAAEEALGLLGGYGSSSEEEEEDGGGG